MLAEVLGRGIRAVRSPPSLFLTVTTLEIHPEISVERGLPVQVDHRALTLSRCLRESMLSSSITSLLLLVSTKMQEDMWPHYY